MMEICSTKPNEMKSAAANGATVSTSVIVHTSNLVRTGIIPTKKVYVSHLLFRNFIDSMTVEVRKRGLIHEKLYCHITSRTSASISSNRVLKYPGGRHLIFRRPWP